MKATPAYSKYRSLLVYIIQPFVVIPQSCISHSLMYVNRLYQRPCTKTLLPSKKTAKEECILNQYNGLLTANKTTFAIILKAGDL